MKNINDTIARLRTIDPSMLLANAGQLWVRFFKFFLLFLFLGAAAWGGVLWYDSIYDSGWSDERKEAYLQEQQKNVQFKEENFSAVIEATQARRAAAAQEVPFFRDLFYE
ncbi:MAG TPA: hypothetical protein VJL38_01740 [Patescibacteria group bacterium]|nr:hypothetical protein [Patescibacteria group bacterium]